jgi:hypothetical protein
MVPNIASIFDRIENRQLPVAQSAACVAFTQGEAFFHLAAAKNARAEALRAHFARVGFGKVFLGNNIRGFDCQIPGSTVQYLDKGFFTDEDEASRARKRAQLENAVVIVNNNDVGQGMAQYADFYTRCDKTIFVAWDWDNHHWLDLSTFLAAHSDIYAPGHHENLYLLTRYNWATAGPVYCSVVQWGRRFLAENLPLLLTNPRSADPLGKHIPYGPFTFRNRVVSTLSQHYPSIGFSDRTFHVRTPEERLKEWADHKAHWIVPVLNDVPIRIFDALVTGGIPIVPESMRYLPLIRDIDREHIVFSSPHDIMDPRAVVNRANALFDAHGQDGLVARHRFALDHHHGDQRMQQVMAFVRERFAATPQ